jgi:hypothetical protein
LRLQRASFRTIFYDRQIRRRKIFTYLQTGLLRDLRFDNPFILPLNNDVSP